MRTGVRKRQKNGVKVKDYYDQKSSARRFVSFVLDFAKIQCRSSIIHMKIVFNAHLFLCKVSSNCLYILVLNASFDLSQEISQWIGKWTSEQLMF